MSNRIHIRELEKAIARARDVFVTKDISEQADFRAAHPAETATHSHWHAFVGTAISLNRGVLGVESIGRSARGERWSKLAGAKVASRGAVSDTPSPAPRRAADSSGSPDDLGPQYRGDATFTARIRLHQSWWRATVLRVPCGAGPRPTSESCYGNMLTAEDGASGKNFLTPEIFAIAKRRLAEGTGAVEPFRLLHNMLSSQPMCFNLFAPLVDRPDRALRLLAPLVGDAIARVRSVRLEWAPMPADAYLADRTAFDAMIEYERRDGGLVLLGIETKLTDSFSQTPYDGERYRRWMSTPRSPFRADASSLVSTPRFNQVWRNHLLAIAARDRGGSPYAGARSVVLHHPIDTDAAAVVAGYRELLHPDDDTFTSWTLDRVIDAFAAQAAPDERDERDESAWIEDFRTRYLTLEKSDAAWEALRSGAR